MNKFINKVGEYIDGNGHWFLVGNQDLLQLSKNPITNNFLVRTNTTDYNQSLINFLNDNEIEFNDWKEITSDELSQLLYNNMDALSSYVNGSTYFN
jgi:hypothetical protein